MEAHRDYHDSWCMTDKYKYRVITLTWGCPGGLVVKNLPAVWETPDQSLGWEDPLEEGMATHSSILAWRIPMDRGAWHATVHGVEKDSDTTETIYRWNLESDTDELIYKLKPSPRHKEQTSGCQGVLDKGEWRMDAFELWCWRRLFRVPWTARRSNQSILKEISREYSLERLMLLKLKLQYFGHLMWRADSLEKTLMLEKIEGRRRRGRQRMRWLDGITDSMDMSLSKLWSWWWTGKPGVLQSMGSQRIRHNWATELNRYIWLSHSVLY